MRKIAFALCISFCLSSCLAYAQDMTGKQIMDEQKKRHMVKSEVTVDGELFYKDGQFADGLLD